jgi:hypothetical protein
MAAVCGVIGMSRDVSSSLYCELGMLGSDTYGRGGMLLHNEKNVKMNPRLRPGLTSHKRARHG